MQRFLNKVRAVRGSVLALSGAVVFTVAVLVFVPHTDAEGATAWLEARGYTQVEITGFTFFACDKSSLTHTGFRAINNKGKAETGTVCYTPLWGNSLSWI